jgi:hypothetical protein
MSPRAPLTLLARLALCLALCGSAWGGTRVVLRTNTSHALENARGAVLDAGLKLGSEVEVTPSSPGASHYLPPERLLEEGRSVGASILSSSFSGWHSYLDSANYLKLTGHGMLHVYAYEPRRPQPPQAPPPAAFSTVNRIGGATGAGIEFGVPDGYLHGKGKAETPSGATAQLAGLMACLKFQHPEWNWFDVKAALRATAANFATGYQASRYGYGSIDYPAANALRDPRRLPLFPPAAVMLPQKDGSLAFAVNAFQQTRRSADALYRFTRPPAPTATELTQNQIAALGGQLVFQGDSVKGGNGLKLWPARATSIYFVWFTRDAGGSFSRIESYSVLGPVQLKPVLPLGPRLPGLATPPPHSSEK